MWQLRLVHSVCSHNIWFGTFEGRGSFFSATDSVFVYCTAKLAQLFIQVKLLNMKTNHENTIKPRHKRM